jgi:hypothetical protein
VNGRIPDKMPGISGISGISGMSEILEYLEYMITCLMKHVLKHMIKYPGRCQG